MRLAFVTLISLILVLITACTTSEAENVTIEERDGVVYVENQGEGLWSGEVPVEFELEQVYGADAEPDEAVLAGVRSMVVDDEANLYLLDYQNYRIVSFYPDGTVRWAAGREGEGPGEFSWPAGLVWDGEDRLLITNQMGQRLDVWSTDGTFERSYPLDDMERNFVRVIGFIQPSTLVLSASEAGQVGNWLITAELAEEIEEEHAFFAEQHPSLDLGRGMSASMDLQVNNGKVFSGYTEHYRIEVFDVEGNLERVILRPEVDYLMPPAVEVSNDRSQMRMLGGLRAPVHLSPELLVTQAQWPTNVRYPEEALDMEWDDVEFAYSLDFFDNEGRFLGSLDKAEMRFEEAERPRHVDADGRLYTYSEAPYPQVRRYRVAQ